MTHEEIRSRMWSVSVSNAGDSDRSEAEDGYKDLLDDILAIPSDASTSQPPNDGRIATLAVYPVGDLQKWQSFGCEYFQHNGQIWSRCASECGGDMEAVAMGHDGDMEPEGDLRVQPVDIKTVPEPASSWCHDVSQIEPDRWCLLWWIPMAVPRIGMFKTEKLTSGRKYKRWVELGETGWANQCSKPDAFQYIVLPEVPHE